MGNGGASSACPLSHHVRSVQRACSNEDSPLSRPSKTSTPRADTKQKANAAQGKKARVVFRIIAAASEGDGEDEACNSSPSVWRLPSVPVSSPKGRPPEHTLRTPTVPSRSAADSRYEKSLRPFFPACPEAPVPLESPTLPCTINLVRQHNPKVANPDCRMDIPVRRTGLATPKGGSSPDLTKCELCRTAPIGNPHGKRRAGMPILRCFFATLGKTRWPARSLRFRKCRGVTNKSPAFRKCRAFTPVHEQVIVTGTLHGIARPGDPFAKLPTYAIPPTCQSQSCFTPSNSGGPPS